MLLTLNGFWEYFFGERLLPLFFHFFVIPHALRSFKSVMLAFDTVSRKKHESSCRTSIQHPENPRTVMLDPDPASRKKYNASSLTGFRIKYGMTKEVVPSCRTPIQHPEKNIMPHHYWIPYQVRNDKEVVLSSSLTGFRIKYGMTKEVVPSCRTPIQHPEKKHTIRHAGPRSSIQRNHNASSLLDSVSSTE